MQDNITCPHCGASFDTQEELDEHIEMVHSDEDEDEDKDKDMI